MKRYIDGKIVAHEKQKKDGANPIAFKKKIIGNFKPDFGQYSELVQ